MSSSSKQTSTPSQFWSTPSPVSSAASGRIAATVSLQSVVRSVASPSLASRQSASVEARVSAVASRKPSLSSSSKQVSAPSQFWSTPSPVSSVAPGRIAATVSLQSVVRSDVVPSLASRQSASVEARVSAVASRKPSSSSSSKQVSWPSQFWSTPSPVSSVAPGRIAATVSLQSVVRSLDVPSLASAQSRSLDTRVSPLVSRKPSLSSSSKHSSWPLQSPSMPSPATSVPPGRASAWVSSQSVVRSVFRPSFGSSQSRSLDRRVSPLVSRKPSLSSSS